MALKSVKMKSNDLIQANQKHAYKPIRPITLELFLRRNVNERITFSWIQVVLQMHSLEFTPMDNVTTNLR